MDLQFVTRNVKNECMEMNEEGDRETQGPIQSDCEKADPWKEFVSLGTVEDGRGRCRCIHCGKVLVTPCMTSNLWRHLRSCPMRPKTISGGGNEEQDRQCNSSIDVVGGGSVSVSNSDREGVVRNNTHLKKRQRSSSAMLLCLDVLDCPICFEALTIPIFQVLVSNLFLSFKCVFWSMCGWLLNRYLSGKHLLRK